MLKQAVLGLILFSSTAALADSWMPASKQTYYAQDQNVRLTVLPRDIASSGAYFGDKVEGREPAGALAGSQQSTATAVLERRNVSGQWKRVWTKPLINDVAPVDVVVANEGRGFATFDNWASMGYGPDAIAIYSSDGTLVRKFGLEDLFPNWFVAALPRSVSSIHWRGDPRISADGTELIVPVVQPTTEEFSVGEGRKIDLTLRLVDGVPMDLELAKWKTALVEAAAVARASCADERETLRKWNAPIVAPPSSKEEDWHYYLRETQYRTKWSEDPPAVGTTVLRAPKDSNFPLSLKRLQEALSDTAETSFGLRAIGSPDLPRLTMEIERIGRSIRPDQLKGVNLVIVADIVHADRIRNALMLSGASLEVIDPKQSFPQIGSRIQDNAELVTCQAPEPTAR